MTRHYVDTSALYALYDEDDRRHADASAYLERRGPDDSLVSHVAVVTEAVALLDRRLGTRSADRFIHLLLPTIAVFHGTELANIRGMQEFRLGAGRSRPSMTDCLSFETMREFELDTAFAFDAHFIEAGFQTVP